MAKRRLARAALASIASVSALVLAGCNSADSSSDAASSSSAPPSALLTDFSKAPTTGAGFQTYERLGDSPKVGDCVNSSGKVGGSVDVGDCGSAATYRIVQIVKMPKECVGDVDNKFFRSKVGGDHWTACLDYNWRIGSCIEVSTSGAAAVACDRRPTVKSARVYKPTGLLLNESSMRQCPQKAGFEHAVREFTVCVEPVAAA